MFNWLQVKRHLLASVSWQLCYDRMKEIEHIIIYFSDVGGCSLLKHTHVRYIMYEICINIQLVISMIATMKEFLCNFTSKIELDTTSYMVITCTYPLFLLSHSTLLQFSFSYYTPIECSVEDFPICFGHVGQNTRVHMCTFVHLKNIHTLIYVMWLMPPLSFDKN